MKFLIECCFNLFDCKKQQWAGNVFEIKIVDKPESFGNSLTEKDALIEKIRQEIENETVCLTVATYSGISRLENYVETRLRVPPNILCSPNKIGRK